MLQTVGQILDAPSRNRLSEVLGLPKTAHLPVAAAVSTIIESLLSASRRFGGAQKVFDVIKRLDGSLAANFRIILESDESSRLSGLGRDAISALDLAGPRICRRVADASGLPLHFAMAVTETLFPLVLSIAARECQEQGLDRDGVTTLLESQLGFFTEQPEATVALSASAAAAACVPQGAKLQSNATVQCVEEMFSREGNVPSASVAQTGSYSAGASGAAAPVSRSRSETSQSVAAADHHPTAARPQAELERAVQDPPILRRALVPLMCVLAILTYASIMLIGRVRGPIPAPVANAASQVDDVHIKIDLRDVDELLGDDASWPGGADSDQALAAGTGKESLSLDQSLVETHTDLRAADGQSRNETATEGDPGGSVGEVATEEASTPEFMSVSGYRIPVFATPQPTGRSIYRH